MPRSEFKRSPREPILNLPGALTALLILLFGIHFARWLLPADVDDWVVLAFGFVPARYDSSLLAGQFPGGTPASIWSFLSYALLHADLRHIGFNTLWMLPFGSALARRLGALRFYLFMALTAVAGAAAHLAAHLLTHQHEVAPMIGASAAVSGAMAASIRFAFGNGGFLSFRRSDAVAAALVPALPLSEALRDPRVLAFLAVWFGINIVFGIGVISVAAQSGSVAWQAHIGGFVAGLVLFSAFDPIPPARGDKNHAVPESDLN